MRSENAASARSAMPAAAAGVTGLAPAAEPILAAAIVRFHDGQLRERDWPVMTRGPASRGPASSGPVAALWEAVAANHRYNGLLWQEGVRMRRAGAGSDDPAASRCLIDRYDGKRRRAIEAVDQALLSSLKDVAPHPDARLSHDTAGMMIDRLSRLSIEFHHLRARTGSADGRPQRARLFSSQRETLLTERIDLADSIDKLLREARAGLAWFQVFRCDGEAS